MQKKLRQYKKQRITLPRIPADFVEQEEAVGFLCCQRKTVKQDYTVKAAEPPSGLRPFLLAREV